VLAALGVAQMGVLAERVEARRHLFARYHSALRDIPGVEFQDEPAGSRSNRWLTCLLLPESVSPEALCGHLARHNIEARPLWKPMHLQPVYAHARMFGGAVSEALFARGVCLPSGSHLQPEEQDTVIALVRDFLQPHA